jgi:4-hydroxyphenylpyruvate dioxygenase-like putative hemolysin
MRKQQNHKGHIWIALMAVVFAIATVVAGCSPADEKKSVKIPETIIQPDSMVSLIADLQIAEATLREYTRLGQHDEARSRAFMAEVFDKHNVTPQHYDSSTAWYEQHLQLYQQIYTDVVTRLSLMQAEDGKGGKQNDLRFTN